MNIEELAEIKGKTFKHIPDARAVTNPLWRAHMFKKIDGQMKMGLHNAEECEVLSKDGWTLSPLDHMGDFQSELGEDADTVESAIEGMTHILNTLGNINHIKDKESLVKFLHEFFGIEINPKAKLNTIRAAIRKAAKKQGCWIEQTITEEEAEKLGKEEEEKSSTTKGK